MLVTSIFFFSHNVFKRLLSQDRLKSGLCGKELTLNQNKKNLDVSKLNAFAVDKLMVAPMTRLVLGTVENIDKGQNAGCQHFLLFQQCF